MPQLRLIAGDTGTRRGERINSRSASKPTRPEPQIVVNDDTMYLARLLREGKITVDDIDRMVD